MELIGRVNALAFATPKKCSGVHGVFKCTTPAYACLIQRMHSLFPMLCYFFLHISKTCVRMLDCNVPRYEEGHLSILPCCKGKPNYERSFVTTRHRPTCVLPIQTNSPDCMCVSVGSLFLSFLLSLSPLPLTTAWESTETRETGIVGAKCVGFILFCDNH